MSTYSPVVRIEVDTRKFQKEIERQMRKLREETGWNVHPRFHDDYHGIPPVAPVPINLAKSDFNFNDIPGDYEESMP